MIRTTPAEGTVVVPGDDILVVISSGPAVKPVTMLPVVWAKWWTTPKRHWREDLHLSVKVVTMDSDKPGVWSCTRASHPAQRWTGDYCDPSGQQRLQHSSGETPSPSESTNPGSSSQPEDPSVSRNLKSKDVGFSAQ